MLTEKSKAILNLIAEGHGYDAILAKLPYCTTFDISLAAWEALELENVKTKAKPAGKRNRHPERVSSTDRVLPPMQAVAWTGQEENRAIAAWEEGMDIPSIAALLERTPASVLIRLRRLDIEV